MLCPRGRRTSSWSSGPEEGHVRHRETSALHDQVPVPNSCRMPHMPPKRHRPRMSIQRCMLRNMMAEELRLNAGGEHAMLWLMAYTFLLRLPSEALCMCVTSAEHGHDDKKSIVWRSEGELCIRLSSRKNLPNGSGVIKRRCGRLCHRPAML